MAATTPRGTRAARAWERHRVCVGGAALLTMVLILGSTPGCGRVRRPPNVIVIVADTLRADTLGCYGFEGEVSPTIDALAAESVLYERCIAPAPWTKPSIASLFTSLSPRGHGVLGHPQGSALRSAGGPRLADVLSEQATTLAERFRDGEYETAAFVANSWLRAGFGFDQGFDTYVCPERNLHDAGVLVDAGLDWLRSRDRARPFLAYWHFMDVHGPYQCSPEDYGAVISSRSLGEERQLDEAELLEIPDYLRFGSSIADQDRLIRSVRSWRACYAAGVRRFDRKLRVLLDGLEAEGVLDDAVVIFLGDHGEALRDHGAWGHGMNLHAELTRVPLLLRLPRGVGGGTRVKTLTGLIDVLPTLMHLAGLTIDLSSVAGAPLPLSDEEDPTARERHLVADAVHEGPKQLSIENERFKLILGQDTSTLGLYDLQLDPTERDDLSASRPDLDEGLRAALARHVSEEAGRPRLTAGQGELSPSQLEELRALGYVH